ncbi:MAG: RHS repeat-associated core domain-containing protein, partial [Thermodesulfobacteriota bacterium]
NRPAQLRESLHRLPRAATVQTANESTSYLLGYDQVGSLKAVAAMDGPHEGRVVKVVDYDAFGQILSDSNPALFMPIAFAGGLRDKFTGLVRFLHRDYDPTIGRFTAPDPLGDTGGDHDLYDYCVDDPVGRVDPEGTLPFLIPLAFLAGQAGATALGWLGVKAAQKGAEAAAETMGDDKLKKELPEKTEAMDKATTDAMKTVTAINAGIAATAAASAGAVKAAPVVAQAAKELPGAAAKAAEAVKTAATTAGQAATSMALDPKNIEFVQDAIAGSTDTPPIMTPGGVTGAAMSKAVDWIRIGGKVKGMPESSPEKIRIEDSRR